MVAQHLPWTKQIVPETGQTQEEWLDDWLSWCIQMGFAGIWCIQKKPVGYIIARPVRIEWIAEWKGDYFHHLQDFDFKGPCVWIDSLWAPRFYSSVTRSLLCTGKRWVAWNHSDKNHIIPIRQLSGYIPNLQHIKQARKLAEKLIKS